MYTAKVQAYAAKSFIQHSQKAERTILLYIFERLLMLVGCRKSLAQWMWLCMKGLRKFAKGVLHWEQNAVEW